MAGTLAVRSPARSAAGALPWPTGEEAPATGAHGAVAAAVLGYRFDALGCSGRIRIAGVTQHQAEAFVIDALAWLRDLERRLTRFSDDSVIGRLNALAGRGSVQADGECLAVIAAADQAWKASAGRLDATILPLWRLWHAVERRSWPAADEVRQARALVGWCKLRRHHDALALALPGMAVDLGGVGKEWAVDQLVERAAAAGIRNLLVELGGDCRASGRQGDPAGWWVALPGARAALLLADEALATSGTGTRRRLLAGRHVPHLIDALSGMPGGGGLRFASVLSPSCLEAGIRASDCCLLDTAAPASIAARSGGSPTWCGGADQRLYADPRLLARVHAISTGAADP
jgi:thiamine biosynthesis lipoprotein